jgi:class 3 adenylate cyclase
MTTPRTRYAHSGDASIAYQVVGDGPLDLVVVSGPASHVELTWEEPTTARSMRQLASFSRLVLFDRRGTGLSDPVDRPPTLEQQMDDLHAVMEAVGIERMALMGGADLGLCALFAASFPDEVSELVLTGVSAWGGDVITPEVRSAVLDAVENRWGDGSLVSLFAPSKVGDRAFEEWWGRMQRSALSPSMARRILEMSSEIDLRAILPTLRVPPLVIHRTDDQYVGIDRGREVASLIPGARFLELPGSDTYGWASDDAGWIDEVEEFLTGRRRDQSFDRVLATVLFTDIVGSTDRAASLGDRRWRDLLDEHNNMVRLQLERWRGIEIKTIGDGFLATFDGPARAVKCAADIVDAAAPMGLSVRTGLHTGECELIGDDVGGIAVHIGARVMASAQAGEVLASSTVRDLVVGSGLQFEDRGEHELKGVPDPWHLYALER